MPTIYHFSVTAIGTVKKGRKEKGGKKIMALLI
jgi:hypothetical protein